MRAAIGTNNVDHLRAALTRSNGGRSGRHIRFRGDDQQHRRDSGHGRTAADRHEHERIAPVIANQIIKAKRRGAKIIVADPRRVPMTRFADIHLRLNPGTDVALLNGIAHTILKEQLHDAEFISAHAADFEAWQASVAAYTPKRSKRLRSPAASIIAAARMYGSSRKAGVFYTMGITQHSTGTDNVRAIANLALLTAISVGQTPALTRFADRTMCRGHPTQPPCPMYCRDITRLPSRKTW